jgi:hypothetical protein
MGLEVKAPLPADRPLGFAAAAQQQINGALFRCEERYPNDGAHSVLYVVVERDAPQLREKLSALHEEYFPKAQTDPLAPVRLEVIDRATDEALNRLIELGLVSRTTRAIRPLFSIDIAPGQPLPLSEEEQQKAGAQRGHAARKIKMANLLGEGGLCEEARGALLDAVLPLGRALAIESRLPEPGNLDEAFLAPLAHRWGDRLAILREFTRDPAAPWKPVAEQLQQL